MKHPAFLGVLPCGTVNTVGTLNAEAVMESLVNGEAVIPCSIEHCRALFGEKATAPIDLDAAAKQSRFAQPAGAAT